MTPKKISDTISKNTTTTLGYDSDIDTDTYGTNNIAPNYTDQDDDGARLNATDRDDDVYGSNDKKGSGNKIFEFTDSDNDNPRLANIKKVVSDHWRKTLIISITLFVLILLRCPLNNLINTITGISIASECSEMSADSLKNLLAKYFADLGLSAKDGVQLVSVDTQGNLSTTALPTPSNPLEGLKGQDGIVTVNSDGTLTVVPASSLDGEDGSNGATGPQGPAGPAGANGGNGSDGATGPMGPSGGTGSTGPAGPAGPAGSSTINGGVGPNFTLAGTSPINVTSVGNTTTIDCPTCITTGGGANTSDLLAGSNVVLTGSGADVLVGTTNVTVGINPNPTFNSITTTAGPNNFAGTTNLVDLNVSGTTNLAGPVSITGPTFTTSVGTTSTFNGPTNFNNSVTFNNPVTFTTTPNIPLASDNIFVGVAGIATAVAPGANGDVLTIVGTTPTWVAGGGGGGGALLGSNNIWTGTNTWNNTSTFNGPTNINGATFTTSVGTTSTFNGPTNINNTLTTSGPNTFGGNTSFTGPVTFSTLPDIPLPQNNIFVGSASNLAAPVGPGANGDVLTIVAGAPTWVAGGGGGPIPVSSLLPAVASNAINNADFTQTWNWNSLTTGIGMYMGTSAVTSGSLLSLGSTSAVSTNGGAILRLTNTGGTGNISNLVATSTSTGAATVATFENDASTSPLANILVADSGSNGFTGIVGDFSLTGTGATVTGTALRALVNGVGSLGTAMHVLNNGAGTSLLVEDAGADPSPFLIDASGNVGIGDSTPAVKLEIDSGVANTSGTRFTQLTSASPTSVGQAIGVDATGNIVTVASGAGGLTTASNGLNVSGTDVRLGGSLSVAGATSITSTIGSNFLRSTDTNLNIDFHNTTSGLSIGRNSNSVQGHMVLGALIPNSPQLVFEGRNSSPILVAANHLSMYFDSTSNTLRCSLSGGAYSNCAASGAFGSIATDINGLTDGITDYVTDMNMFMGSTAGDSVLAGAQRNVGIGINALTSLSTGDDNVALGYRALDSLTTGINNIAIGSDALGNAANTGNGNVAIGVSTLNNNTTGQENVAIGNGSVLGSNSTGFHNVALGSAALGFNTTGSYNIGFGVNTLNNSKVISGAIAIGRGALQNQDTSGLGLATNNIAIGYMSMNALTDGFSNTAVGYQALDAVTTGNHNSAFGTSALGANTGNSNSTFGSLSLVANLTGSANSAFGFSSMAVNTTGDENSAFGENSGSTNSTGSRNVFIGSESGANNTTGSNNVFVGFNSRAALNNLTNATAIGNLATVGANNALVLGSINGINGATSDVNVGIGTTTPSHRLHITDTTDTDILRLQDSDGSCLHNPEAGAETVTCSSDARLKSNIVDASSALEFLQGIQVREYTVNASGKLMTGVIAQEMLGVHPEMVTTSADGTLMVEQPNPWILVKGLQEVNTKVEGLGEKVNSSVTNETDMNKLEITATLISQVISSLQEVISITFQSITVTGKAIFAGVAEFMGDVVINGRLTLADADAGGFAIIPSGSQEVHIRYQNEFAQEPIVNVTQKGVNPVAFAVINTTTQGFTIQITSPATSELSFAWSTTAVKNARLSEGVKSTESKSVEVQEQPVVSPTSTPTVETKQEIEASPSPVITSAITATPSPTITQEATQNTQSLRVLNNPEGFVNVRESPSIDGAIINQVNPDEVLPYSAISNDWYQITLSDGKSGWISGSFVTIN